MGSSEGNKINDGTSFEPSKPALCTNGCGLFGTAATMGLCSKCYSYSRIEKGQAASSKIEEIARPEVKAVLDVGTVGPSAVEEKALREVAAAAAEKKVVVSNRCLSCNKKVGLMGFKCRCGSLLCGTHRYPEKHDCTFDFKGQGKEAIAKANPVIKADKIQRF